MVRGSWFEVRGSWIEVRGSWALDLPGHRPIRGRNPAGLRIIQS